jgi:hypothetical protein
MQHVNVDHVILATSRLDAGMDAFARLTGVVPERGGVHPGRGTENALAGLDEGRYLEILAPVSPSGPAAADLAPSSWALRVSDIAGAVARLRSAGFTADGPIPGSRRRPDGSVLHWETAAVSGPGLELAPFLIEWAAGTAHPSATSPAGCALERTDVTVPQPAALQRFFDTLGLGMKVGTGERRLHLVLACPKGRVEL